jgi:hypothetical protein
MMGVPLHEPVYCYGDNMSVIQNTQNPESTLKKKSNFICYHFIREAIAMGDAMTDTFVLRTILRTFARILFQEVKREP